MLIVAKFGGSSLANAEQFKKVADIIKSDSRRTFIIVSAPGKDKDHSEKITDLLYRCADLRAAGENYLQVLESVFSRFEEISRGLGLDPCEDDFETIRADIKGGAGRDYIASRGEYLCGKLLARFLNVPFMDSKRFIFFGPDGKVDYDRSYPAICSVLKEGSMAVIPGFYGLSATGVQTFSRGGSDITGALIAAAAEADLYENWTDVSGIMSADPRTVPSPKIIDSITYNELREMAYMGASVLHEEAVFPVKARKIPIRIKNTDDPAAPGTLISSDSGKQEREVTGLAVTHDFAVMDISAPSRSGPSLIKRILTTFEKQNIFIEHMPWGRDKLQVVINKKDLDDSLRLMGELERASRPQKITLRSDIALIAIVGRGIESTGRLFTKVRAILEEESIPVLLADEQYVGLELIIGVEERDAEKAINLLYSALIK